MIEMTPKEAAESLRDTAKLLDNPYRREALRLAADTLDPPPPVKWDTVGNGVQRNGRHIAFCYDDSGNARNGDVVLANHRANICMEAMRADEEANR